MMTTNITLLNTSTSHTVYWEESGSSDILPKSNINWPKENEKKKNIGQFLILTDFSITALFFKFQLNKILLKI